MMAHRGEQKSLGYAEIGHGGEQKSPHKAGNGTQRRTKIPVPMPDSAPRRTKISALGRDIARKTSELQNEPISGRGSRLTYFCLFQINRYSTQSRRLYSEPTPDVTCKAPEKPRPINGLTA